MNQGLSVCLQLKTGQTHTHICTGIHTVGLLPYNSHKAYWVSTGTSERTHKIILSHSTWFSTAIKGGNHRHTASSHNMDGKDKKTKPCFNFTYHDTTYQRSRKASCPFLAPRSARSQLAIASSVT